MIVEETKVGRENESVRVHKDLSLNQFQIRRKQLLCITLESI